MKNNKFMISLCLFIVATFLITSARSTPVLADKGNNENHGEVYKAYLINSSTGEKTQLPVTSKKSADGKSIQYEVIVLSGSVSESHSRFDGSIGVKLTITQYFDEYWGSNHYVSLDRSTAKWERFDSSISISNAKVGSRVYAFTAPSGGTRYSRNENKTIWVPANNTWYTHIPSWRGVFLVVNDLWYQASQASSTLTRGGSTWSLGFCVAQGGSAVVDCE